MERDNVEQKDKKGLFSMLKSVVMRKGVSHTSNNNQQLSKDED